jgi:hypothetical protein
MAIRTLQNISIQTLASGIIAIPHLPLPLAIRGPAQAAIAACVIKTGT